MQLCFYKWLQHADGQFHNTHQVHSDYLAGLLILCIGGQALMDYHRQVLLPHQAQHDFLLMHWPLQHEFSVSKIRRRLRLLENVLDVRN